MVGVKLDRGHRGKINATSGTPDANTKGNIAQDADGFLHTRKASGEPWRLSSPFQNSGSTIFPAFSGATHYVKDYTESFSAMVLGEDRCYYGDGAVCYVSDGTALAEILESTFQGTIVLGPRSYSLPHGVTTISYEKRVVGVSRNISKIVLPDVDASDYILITNAANVVFSDLTISRAHSVSGTSPDALVALDKSDYCGFYRCTFGDANLYMSSGCDAIIKTLSACDYLTIDSCEFATPNDIAPLHPALILLTASTGVSITNNFGADLCCNGSIVADDCYAININNNVFSNNAAKDTCVGISLTGSSAASYVCNNRISNENNYGTLTSANLLYIDDTGITAFVSNLTVTDNQLYFTVAAGREDDAPEAALVTLGIKSGIFSNNRVLAEYHGYEDDVAIDVVPSKVVVFAYGERLTISNNIIRAANCRCALMMDSQTSGASPGEGNRIVGNEISGFSIDTPGAIAGTGIRNDSSGIYLSDNSLGLPPSGIVISNNTVGGDINSTAIRGCPLNCYPPSFPPSSNESAERCSILGNVIKTDLRDDIYGISVATIGFSTIIGNVSLGDGSVIDTSDVAGYTNTTNEYGATGSSEPGANL
jgi:hypothetical protein